MLYLVGRSMRNMLEYIKQNYKTHFSGITIDSIASMEIDLNGSEKNVSTGTPKNKKRPSNSQ